KSIAGVSAPAKGMTLLNYCRIGTEVLDFVTEKAELKIGRFTPGSHIPVRPDAELLRAQPDYALLLAWNFAEEIMRNLDEYRKKGAVRGNHYHKKTTQYLYVLHGRFRAFEQRRGGPVEQRVLKAGDLWITPPRARHAILALEEGTFVACARGPRAGKDYENDTY